MTSSVSNSTKVRIACQRCRAKRVRCDGGIPSCSNCAKAGVTCVDVDARDTQRLVPRATIAQAKARIQWLEAIVTEHLPTIDLCLGPQFEPDFSREIQSAVGDASQQKSVASVTVTRSPITTAPKRTHGVLEASQDESLQAEARSVAHDLGRFSINADPSEKHYLGSSSGLVFPYLTQSEGSPSSMTEISTRPISRRQQAKPSFAAAHQALKNTLPSKDDALHLIDLYVRHIYPDHPVLHLQSLFKALDALYVCRDATAELDHFGWPLGMPAFSYNGELSDRITLSTIMFHIFMVFTLAASVHLSQTEPEFAAGQFHRTALVVAPDVLGEISMPSLQAVYLMAVHCLMAPVKTSIWTLSYICTAHAVDLGIHRRQEGQTLTANVMAGLVFYSVYSLDRCLASIQGRPLGLRDEAFDVCLPKIEDLHRDINQQDIPSSCTLIASDAMHYTLHKFELDKIISDIKTLFYFLPPETESASWSVNNKSHQPHLFSKLVDWHSRTNHILPPFISDRKLRQLQLEQLYHSAVVLLFQPSQVCRHPDDAALQVCLRSSTQQIHCFNTLYELDMLQFDWRTVRTIFAAGTTVIYTFLKNHSKDQQDEVMDTLRLTSILLAVSGIWWPSIKKARTSFERLVNLMRRKLQNVDSVSVHKRRQVNSPSRLSTVDSTLPPDSSHFVNLELHDTLVEGNSGRSADYQATSSHSAISTLIPELDSFLNENHFLDDTAIDFLNSDSFIDF